MLSAYFWADLHKTFWCTLTTADTIDKITSVCDAVSQID